MDILKPLADRIKDIRSLWSEIATDEDGDLTALNLIFYTIEAGERLLNLGDFIPCLNGKPLKDPESTMKQGDGQVYYTASDEDFKEYQKAEQKVIFKGWVVANETESGIILGNKEMSYSIGYRYSHGFFLVGGDKVKTIESIAHLNLELTKYGKEIGL